jgi:hypothetical protein
VRDVKPKRVTLGCKCEDEEDVAEALEGMGSRSGPMPHSGTRAGALAKGSSPAKPPIANSTLDAPQHSLLPPARTSSPFFPIGLVCRFTLGCASVVDPLLGLCGLRRVRRELLRAPALFRTSLA